ncbi:MAG: aminoglycoside phosphotransferase family protein [Caldimonas sp.]
MNVAAARTDRADVPPEFARALVELGLAGEGERLVGAPLAGGVSSDIWRIDTANGPVCAKRALAKLRVAADWRAPVDRNRYEARWLEVANAAQPGAAPRLLGQHAELGVVVMTWLAPDEHRLWKEMLRDGNADLATASAVGATLGRIHAYSAARPELAARFDSDAIFHAIRLEPYLLATARSHPDLAPALERLVATTAATKRALVHGDVSPKNIVIGPNGPVLLDAECAWWGEPAFDLAFCLNHLLLKCLWTPAATPAFLAAFAALAAAYLEAVDWEPREAIERRAAALLPGLFLARVDGKSPVEYIDSESDRDRVRRVAGTLIRQPVARLGEVAAAWQDALATR